MSPEAASPKHRRDVNQLVQQRCRETPPASLKRTQDWIATQTDAPLPASLPFVVRPSTKTRLFWPKPRLQRPMMLHGTSFDSQDSTGTCQSFRIAADHSCAECMTQQDTRDQARKDKLAIAGVLEQCTQMLHNSLLPAEQRLPAKASSLRVASNVQRNESIVSMAASMATRVSDEFQAKSGRTVQKAVRKCHQIIEERERQLVWAKEEVSRKMRDPMITQLTEDAEALRRDLKASSRQSFELKLETQELRIEMDTLRRVRHDACASVHRLRDCRSKYGKVCAENCALNRTIQHLQGAVRVVCHVPVRPSGSYLETTNRGEVTFTGKKKSRSYAVDDVISGEVSTHQMQRLLKPIATSVLDGMDATLIGIESLNGEEECCFRHVMAHAVDVLLYTVDDRFYHASYELDFELSFVSAYDGHGAVSRTRLPAKLRVPEETITDRLKNIQNWITNLLARRDNLQNFERAHAVIRINVRSRARHESEGSKKLSTLSFIQIHPASAGKWMDVKQQQSIASTLIELSANRTPLSQPVGDKDAPSLLKAILHGNKNNAKLYTLFLELSNAHDDEKKDKAALHLCSKIMASRVVSMDETSRDREKTALTLKKEIAEKDEKISKLEDERVELSSRSATVLSDVERLRSEIEALQALKNNKRPSLERNYSQQKPPKQTVSRKHSKSAAQPKRRSQRGDLVECSKCETGKTAKKTPIRPRRPAQQKHQGQ